MNHRGGVKSRRSSQASLRNSRSTFRRSPRGTEEQGLSGNSHAFQTLSYGPIQPWTSPHRPKVYTKGSAVRIRAIAGLVIGTAWRLVLVASPGPLFPRRVGAFYTAGQR